MWMKVCQGLKSGILLFGWGFFVQRNLTEKHKRNLSPQAQTDPNLSCSCSEQTDNLILARSSIELCLAPERSGLLVQAQWCSITATWFLDGCWSKARQLAGWAGCICLYRRTRCFEKGGVYMLEQEPHEESMGCLFLVGFHFVVLFFIFFFPNPVSQSRCNTELKGIPLLKTEDPIKCVTVNPLLFLIQCLIAEIFFKILPIIENWHFF